MLIVCYPDLRLLVMNKSAVNYIRKIAYFLFQTAFRRKVEILQSLHTYRLWCWRLCLARWWNGGTKTETVEVQHHSTTLSRAQSILSCRYIRKHKTCHCQRPLHITRSIICQNCSVSVFAASRINCINHKRLSTSQRDCEDSATV